MLCGFRPRIAADRNRAQEHVARSRIVPGVGRTARARLTAPAAPPERFHLAETDPCDHLPVPDAALRPQRNTSTPRPILTVVKHYPSGSVMEAVSKPVTGTVQVSGRCRAALRVVGRRDHGHRYPYHSAGRGRRGHADFEFDVPVRFDTDHIAVTIETFSLHRWQQIPIVEVRL
jgi:Conserved hypothetical protein 2217 (DUF2460)